MLSRKVHMKKLILAVIVLSIGYFTMVKAEDESVTPQEFIGAVASVPGKIGNHLQNEWEKTKNHQAKSWAEIKFKFKGLKEKFQAKD
tara:strand:+ start:919 stop:1179 length:261 start_codon:yes stop_codon:yes gene_type:complete